MSAGSTEVVVTGDFDDLRSAQIRFLEEAARLGPLTTLLWSDDAFQRLHGKPPKFPQAERLYRLQAIRYVHRAKVVSEPVHQDALPDLQGFRPSAWVVAESQDNASKRAWCKSHSLRYHVLRSDDLRGFPEGPLPPAEAHSPRKKVLVTGCYDWFHSGHVRFFEQVSGYGDLYVVVGHDANIRLLKGEGHPFFPQEERRYVVGSIKYVKQALVSTGEGWLDAEPEIQRIKPNIYAVNEDGDKGGKREYCEQRGIRYLVLKRTPAPGLSKRTSTDLRGF